MLIESTLSWYSMQLFKLFTWLYSIPLGHMKDSPSFSCSLACHHPIWGIHLHLQLVHWPASTSYEGFCFTSSLFTGLPPTLNEEFCFTSSLFTDLAPTPYMWRILLYLWLVQCPPYIWRILLHLWLVQCPCSYHANCTLGTSSSYSGTGWGALWRERSMCGFPQLVNPLHITSTYSSSRWWVYSADLGLQQRRKPGRWWWLQRYSQHQQ